MFNLENVFGKKAKKAMMTKEEIAEFIKTDPEALRSFEESYTKHVKNKVSNNFFAVNAKQAVSEKCFLSDFAAENVHLDALVQRIVAELLDSAAVYVWDGADDHVQTFDSLPENYVPVSNEDLKAVPEGYRPELTGYLYKRDIGEAASGMLLSVYKDFLLCKDPKKKMQLYGMFRQGLDIQDLDPITYKIIDRNRNSMGYWLPPLVQAVKQQDFFKIPQTKVLKVPLPLLQLTRMEYIARIKIRDFGRLSKTFLTGLKGCDVSKGFDGQDVEMISILQTMWETNDNLMEILSDKYTFLEAVEAFTQEYYTGKKKSLKERLDEMSVSNSVRRPVYRTLAVVKDIEKAFGKPDKIFLEMTRGGQADQKGKRIKSRKQQILDLYDKCKDDVHDLMWQLESLGEYADSRLQSDRLYLYFMQFGKCAYSGAHIGFEQLMAGSVEYDIDHIYPQSYVKDDSLNNKVLVLSDLNGTKDNIYPVSPEIRGKMQGLWSWWNHVGAISDEKYKRLIRSAPFTDEEKMGFINRQLTETSQSTKFIADLLKERFPDAEVVYVKAGLVSDFRHEFDLPKSRSYNDLHNAADAFLSVVAGNVYDMRFSKKWFRIDEKYSVKVKTIFTHEVKCRGDIIWDGMPMLEKVEDTARKNTAHFVKYAAFKTGGLFDQNPVKKGTGLIPLKAGLPTEKYGGYNKAGVMFLIPVRYNIGKKSEILILPVELMHGKHFLEDKVFARNYTFTRLENILGKKVGEVSFPMGMRPWKINTMLSFDGFRVCLTGTGGRGKCLVAQPVMQFSADEHWRFYIKRLERFVEKIGINPDLLYDKDHDKVSKDENLKLYELYVDKLQNTIYKKRVNSPVQTLLKGKEEFKKLSIEEQCQVLLNIQSVFGRMTGG